MGWPVSVLNRPSRFSESVPLKLKVYKKHTLKWLYKIYIRKWGKFQWSKVFAHVFF